MWPAIVGIAHLVGAHFPFYVLKRVDHVLVKRADCLKAFTGIQTPGAYGVRIELNVAVCVNGTVSVGRSVMGVRKMVQSVTFGNGDVLRYSFRGQNFDIVLAQNNVIAIRFL